jgi:hypothetical protein
LIAGPAPQGVDGEPWLNLRAKHLADGYDHVVEDCLNGLRHQEQAIDRITDHNEVVLWFEHDLFCQTNMVYLLERLSRRSLKDTKISLVCIDRFPGKMDFRGLGELTPPELASLLDERHEVSTEELKLGARAWAAYRSPTPDKLEDLLKGPISSLPFLGRALEKHMARFPSIRNGLGHIENTALGLISEGASDFVSLFGAFGKREPLYGYGDLPLLNDLGRLENSGSPLLRSNRLDETGDERPPIHKTSFELTELGKAVLKGEADFFSENDVDFWLGGVHLTNLDHWRWDGERSIHAGNNAELDA